MDDKTFQRKLNQFVKLGNELHDAAKRRYGPNALLFHEGDGNVMVMDSYELDDEPNDHIMHRAKGYGRWGTGAF